MIRILARALLVSALCAALGLHWILLQSVAWTSMVVKYAQRDSLYRAVEKTFDGNHPCSLCHALQNGKSSQKKSDLRSVSSKFDLIAARLATGHVWQFQTYSYPAISAHFRTCALPPPVPPPRAAAC